MKKNGFVLIETVIVVVVLTSSLLLLYSTFNKILQTEKTRVYYDDVNYIYRTWYVKNVLDSLNFSVPKNDLDNRENASKSIYFVTLGEDYQGLFDGYESKKVYFKNMLNDFNVTQIILLNKNKINNLKKCTINCAQDPNCEEYANCNEVYTNLSENMINYLKALNTDLDAPYLLVAEYNICNSTNICRNYYGWVGV